MYTRSAKYRRGPVPWPGRYPRRWRARRRGQIRPRGAACRPSARWGSRRSCGGVAGEADGLVDNQVGAIIEDSSGYLWFATDRGVSRYDGVSWTTYTHADGLAYDNVDAILEDSSGNLWFATHGGGVSRHDRVSWTTYTESDGLAFNRVLFQSIRSEGFVHSR